MNWNGINYADILPFLVDLRAQRPFMSRRHLLAVLAEEFDVEVSTAEHWVRRAVKAHKIAGFRPAKEQQL